MLEDDRRHHLKTLAVLSYLPAMMCWVEKFLLIIDYFQVFGILWNVSQPWPWPYQWVYLTRVLNYLNLDFFSLTSNGALVGRTQSTTIPQWGRMDGYIYYAFAFSISSAFLVALFAILRHPTERFGRWNISYRTHLLAILGIVMYIFYNPVLLALVRLYYCEDWPEKGFVLSADPNLQCYAVSHIAITFISSLLALPLLVGVPYIIYKYVEKNRIYHDPHDHEKRLQLWELLYYFQVDPYWLDGHVWMQSSFTRSGSYYYLHMLSLKIAMIIWFVAVRANFIAQASLITVTMCCFVLYFTVFSKQLPFRSLSTNVMFLLVCCMWLFEVFFGLANANEVRNAVVVASTETIFFIVVNTISFVLIAAIMLYDAVIPPVIDWPSMRTLLRIWSDTVSLPQVAFWVESYRESQHVLHDFLLSPIEVADIQALEASIRRCRVCWLQARSQGSLLDTALSELLERLLLVHSSRWLFAHRKHAHWDSAYLENVTAGTFKRREKFVHLMAPRKHSLLVRLLAYRAMRGDHIRSGKFDLTLARKYEQHLKFQEELRLRKRKGGGSAGEDNLQAGESRSDRRRSTFSLFQKNAKLFLDHHESPKNKRMDSIKEDQLGDRDRDSEATDEEDRDDEHKQNENENDKENEEIDFYDERGLPNMARFSSDFIDEAAKMIQRLQERTELALNKHHEASKSLYEQQRLLFLHHLKKQQALSGVSVGISGGISGVSGVSGGISDTAAAAAALAATQPQDTATLQAALQAAGTPGSLSTAPSFSGLTNTVGGLTQSFFNKHGLNKIATMDLMKETADEEEVQDLEDLFHLWDEAILLYEQEEFPGDYEILNVQVENWYTYRNLVSQRLETIVSMINEQEELLDNLGDVHVEEELGGDEDDDDNGSIFHVPLLSDGDIESQSNLNNNKNNNNNNNNSSSGTLTLKRPQVSLYSPGKTGATHPSHGDTQDTQDTHLSPVSQQVLTPVRGRKERHLKGWGVKPSSADDTEAAVTTSPVSRHTAPEYFYAEDVAQLTRYDDDPVGGDTVGHWQQQQQQRRMRDTEEEEADGVVVAESDEDEDEETGLLSAEERQRYRIRK